MSIKTKPEAYAEAMLPLMQALKDMTSERDQLAAALEATSLREAELTAEIGDLPQAQADMLVTIKRLKADAERYRDALDKIETWSTHTATFSINYGSNGVRDFYRAIAREAMKGTS